jgi:hypothetical protein
MTTNLELLKEGMVTESLHQSQWAVSVRNLVAARTGGIEETGIVVTTLCEDVLMALLSLLKVEINQGKPFDFCR